MDDPLLYNTLVQREMFVIVFVYFILALRLCLCILFLFLHFDLCRPARFLS